MISAPSPDFPTAAAAPSPSAPRRFDFARDTFAFPNELVWHYEFDAATGATHFRRRVPPPTYAHRCFVLARAARQFFGHAHFAPDQPPPDEAATFRMIRQVVARNPRKVSPPGRGVVIPGFSCLREFSVAREAILKAACGGAWRSYVLRSHWRMVFPIPRRHQAATAGSLRRHLAAGGVPVVHLVRFPQLTINHGLVLFDQAAEGGATRFLAYDPNQPAHAVELRYDPGSRTFTFAPNTYWAGGRVDVIEIFQGWFY